MGTAVGWSQWSQPPPPALLRVGGERRGEGRGGSEERQEEGRTVRLRLTGSGRPLLGTSVQVRAERKETLNFLEAKMSLK